MFFFKAQESIVIIIVTCFETMAECGDCLADDCKLCKKIDSLWGMVTSAASWCMLMAICTYIMWRLNEAMGILLCILYGLALPFAVYIACKYARLALDLQARHASNI